MLAARQAGIPREGRTSSRHVYAHECKASEAKQNFGSRRASEAALLAPKTTKLPQKRTTQAR